MCVWAGVSTHVYVNIRKTQVRIVCKLTPKEQDNKADEGEMFPARVLSLYVFFFPFSRLDSLKKQTAWYPPKVFKYDYMPHMLIFSGSPIRHY